MFSLLLASIFFLLPAAIQAVALNKIIPPNGQMKFGFDVSPTDQEVSLFISNLTGKTAGLRCKIDSLDNRTSLDSDDDNYDSDDEIGIPIAESLKRKFEKEGAYEVTLYNSGRTDVEFRIVNMTYKKVVEMDKDLEALKHAVSLLQESIEALKTQHYYLNQETHRLYKERDSLIGSMNWLIIFPIATVLVGYLKYLISKQLVKPKGKRFKGLF